MARTFPEAYARFLPPVRAKCRRLLGHPAQADDVAQETFVRLLEANLPLDDVRTVMAWLYRTSTRLSLDHLRHKRRAPAVLADDTLPCGGASQESRLAARRAVLEVMSKAGDDELEAVVLCRVDGLSQPEAAGVLGVSERTVRRLLDRFDEHTRAVRKEALP
jgi:RNA polymerase sigma-70 factor (ECF subfamily)